MAHIEGKPDIREVAHLHDLHQVLGRSDLVGQVLQQQLHAQRAGEGFQVFNCGQRVIQRARIPRIVLQAQVNCATGKWDQLSGFERALDLVHGLDARGLVAADEVERRRGVASPVGLVTVERHMQRGSHRMRSEPVGELAHCVSVGVVKVMPRCEDLNRRGAPGGECVQQRRSQPVLQKDVG